ARRRRGGEVERFEDERAARAQGRHQGARRGDAGSEAEDGSEGDLNMGTVLIVAEAQHDGSLRKATLNALAGGAALAAKAGAELHCAILGKDVSKLADDLKSYGVKVVHAGSGAAFENYLAETHA